jgi:hypothetical protein
LDSQTEIQLASQIDPKTGTAGSGTYAYTSGDYATYNFTGVIPSTASPSSTNAGGTAPSLKLLLDNLYGYWQ